MGFKSKSCQKLSKTLKLNLDRIFRAKIQGGGLRKYQNNVQNFWQLLTRIYIQECSKINCILSDHKYIQRYLCLLSSSRNGLHQAVSKSVGRATIPSRASSPFSSHTLRSISFATSRCKDSSLFKQRTLPTQNHSRPCSNPHMLRVLSASLGLHECLLSIESFRTQFPYENSWSSIRSASR